MTSVLDLLERVSRGFREARQCILDVCPQLSGDQVLAHICSAWW